MNRPKIPFHGPKCFFSSIKILACWIMIFFSLSLTWILLQTTMESSTRIPNEIISAVKENQGKSIFFCSYLIEVFYPIAFTAAVTVNTAMTAPFVDIHIIVVAKPRIIGSITGYN